MFGLAVFLSALAVAGAPATPVRCNPELPEGLQGVTHWDDTRLPASLIELNPQVCRGALFLAASPRELRAIRALNGPDLNVLKDVGFAAEVMLLEVEQASHPYSGPDQTDDLCRAEALLPAFLGKYLSGDDLATAVRWAETGSSSLPPGIYHTHPCKQTTAHG
jgi:hypothetical protein